ncbi:MAG TPA: CtsR family transcriptional regulator [Clostridia bacterium]|nr:CtsR family transcriptional regulator [Clostridia bacterium]
MRSLADQIEHYLKKRLAASAERLIEIQRNEIAEIFACVPSQINYVLTTRFGPEQGYLVESRRGGGGYLRIIKLELKENQLITDLLEEVSDTLVTQAEGESLIGLLEEEGFLTEREGLLMRAVIDRNNLPVELPQRDLVRACILRAMLYVISRKEFL